MRTRLAKTVDLLDAQSGVRSVEGLDHLIGETSSTGDVVAVAVCPLSNCSPLIHSQLLDRLPSRHLKAKPSMSATTVRRYVGCPPAHRADTSRYAGADRDASAYLALGHEEVGVTLMEMRRRRLGIVSASH